MFPIKFKLVEQSKNVKDKRQSMKNHVKHREKKVMLTK
jgi:hypothetical protein